MKEISRDILVQAAQGDIKAFEIIYRESAGYVYTLAMRITNNAHDAEEVTQDVFLKVYHSLGRFQFRSTFKTWLYRIAVNTALNLYKKSSKDMGSRVDFESVESVYPAQTDTAQ